MDILTTVWHFHQPVLVISVLWQMPFDNFFYFWTSNKYVNPLFLLFTFTFEMISLSLIRYHRFESCDNGQKNIMGLFTWRYLGKSLIDMVTILLFQISDFKFLNFKFQCHNKTIWICFNWTIFNERNSIIKLTLINVCKPNWIH